MNSILNQFNEKISNLVKNYVENLIFSKGISSFTDDLVAEFAQFGSDLTQFVIEYAEETIFRLSERKEQFVSLKKDKRNVVSIFGEIEYKRRYYENSDGEKVYLIDKLVGIMPKQRLLDNVRERLVDSAIDTSYEYAGGHAAYGVKISRQEVKNEIEELDLNQSFYDKATNKKQVENIYIIADEDHVHLQKGGIEEPRIIVVYDDIVSNGKRVELKSKRHLGGLYKSRIDDLWEEVATYLEENYDLEYVKRVFISGDGASWIKTGLTWINKSINILDRFHMVKAVNSIAGKDKIENKIRLFRKLRQMDFDGFKDICYEILSEELEKNTRINKEKLMKYILNNREGIENYYEYRKYIHGCSAEGHVSHVYSDRMSSRPMGWKSKNVNNMSKLRLLKADKISVKEIISKQGKIIDLNKYKEIKEKATKKMKESLNIKQVSIPAMTFGKIEDRIHFKELLANVAI